MDGLVNRHHRACDRFGAVAKAFPSEQWAAPTPCTEWTAHALVEHVIGFHEFLLLRPLNVRVHRPRKGRYERWNTTAAALFDCLDAEGVLDCATDLPGGGQSSARLMLAALTTDVLVHTWDLARAGGIEPDLDSELTAAAYDSAMSTGLRRDDGMIGPEIIGDFASDIESRMVAFYSRDPAWQPPA